MDYLLHHFRRISDMDMGDSSKGGWGMSKWKTEAILSETRTRVAEETAGWTADDLRERLAMILATSLPIRATLQGLNDNPKVPHGGMWVRSGMFPEQFSGCDEDLDEPWGYAYDGETKKLKPIELKWSEPQPDTLSLRSAEFQAGETLHEDTEILSVTQSATACSIFIGSFDLTDVRAFCEASALSRPTQNVKGKQA